MYLFALNVFLLHSFQTVTRVLVSTFLLLFLAGPAPAEAAVSLLSRATCCLHADSLVACAVTGFPASITRDYDLAGVRMMLILDLYFTL